MSSLDSDDTPISSSLPITELIKHIKYSFRDRDFNDFQYVLMERENNLQKEIENLKMNPPSAKKVADSANLEKLLLEEKLGKSRRKCLELEEVVARLKDEKKALTDRVKLAEDRRDMIFTENLKMTNEKNNSISELNEKIKELKNKNLESERLAEVFREKCMSLESKMAKMEQELEDLRERKSEADKTEEDLKLANKTIEELKLDKMELDSRLQNSSIRLSKIEENYSKMMTMKIGDIATLVTDKSKFGTSEVGLNLDSQGHQVKKERSSRNVDAKVVVVDAVSPSNGRSDNGLSKKGARNSVKPQTREGIDNAHKVRTSPAKQSGHNLPQEENNEPKEPLSSGAHIGGMHLLSSSHKTSCSSPASAGNIIDIIDSDDEINPDGVSLISNRGFLDTKVVKNKANLVPTQLSSQTSKRNRTDCGEGLLTVKRKRDMCPVDVDLHEKERQIPKQTHFEINSSPEKFNCVSDEDSEDSEDESLSDSKMIELVKNIGRKFTNETDMLEAFQQDEKLCMSAVCALYRQQLSGRESKGRPNPSKNGGFSPSDSASGCALAEYLIDGDKELRLRKSVSEVKKQRPEVIDQCRKLAKIYVGKLFAIHCSAGDPFFGRS